MVIQMMSIAVEIVLQVPELQIHVHAFNICVDIIKISEELVLNHLHHFLRFSNLGNAN